MTKEKIKGVFENTETDDTIQCWVMSGLLILKKYSSGWDTVQAVRRDILISIPVEMAIENGITEEDVVLLRKMNWMIEEESFASYV